jgi:hypothetical protein
MFIEKDTRLLRSGANRGHNNPRAATDLHVCHGERFQKTAAVTLSAGAHFVALKLEIETPTGKAKFPRRARYVAIMLA